MDFKISPDWNNGGEWYRLLPPAGTVIPEQPVEVLHCGSHSAGWLQDSHPQEEGQTMDGRVCFSGDYDAVCQFERSIKVTNCGNFYVYYLPKVSYCYDRYCGADHTTTTVG